MAQINLGNFGGLVAQPAPMPRVGSVPNAAAEAIGDLGEIGQQAALRQIQKDQQAERERRIQQDAADKIATASELARTREELRVAAEEVADGVRTGTIDKTKAPEVWEQRRGQVLQARTEAVPTSMRSLFEKGVAEAMAFPEAAVRKSVRDRDIADNRSGLLSFLEVQQREAVAGNPGARKAALDAISGLGGFAGFSPAEQQGLAQKFEEGVTYTRGYNLANSASTVDQLTDAEKQLKDNPEFAAMDPQRKAVLLNQIDDRRARLIQRAQIEADRREAKAERAIAQAQRQLASGVPLSAEGWSELQRLTAGTSVAGEFAGLVQSERDIQTLLRKPVAEQVAYVQERQAELAQRGVGLGSAEAANVQRLAEAVNRNVRTLQTDPLQFAAQRAGVETAPLDISRMLQPDGVGELRQIIVDRVSTVDGLRRQYGDAVPLQVLKQAEAKALATTLNNASPRDQAAIFSTVRTLAGGDSRVYQAIMRQIAPDSPVKALAGIIGDRTAQITTEHNWIGSNVVRSAGDISATLLRGEAIINAGAGDKAQDGKPRANLFLPDAATFNGELVRYVGAAFADRPQALQVAQQAALAYYVGKAAETGRLNRDSKDVDSKLVREALVATLGEPVERNGSTVFAPWGMGASEFEPRARRAFAEAVAARKMPAALVDRWPQLGLRQVTGDTYMVTQGRALVLDAQNQPITIRVAGPGEPMRDAAGLPVSRAPIPR